MRVGPVFVQRTLVGDSVTETARRHGEESASRVGQTIARLAGAVPGPPTLLIDEPTMDRLHHPRVWATRKVPEQRVEPHGGLFTAMGVCARVDADVARELRPHFEIPPPRGSLVVALCPARIASSAHALGLGDAGHALLGELVRLHELLHWSHGAISQAESVRPAEEAIVQVALAQLCLAHPEGAELRSVMDALATKQPPEYGAYLEIERAAVQGEEPDLRAFRPDWPHASATDEEFRRRNRQHHAAKSMRSRLRPASTSRDLVILALGWAREAGVRPLSTNEITDVIALVLDRRAAPPEVEGALRVLVPGEMVERRPGGRYRLRDGALEDRDDLVGRRTRTGPRGR